MRIQHNIPAMNAYRNYNNNTSALSKNLEKLSSGYKINRAGDDAAGLAISEKMRAQITGLNAATKNVKDGISLVKTAEGAMQEIQDMLNRMDYLATQSANGTYDNEVDRANLQKEMDALKTEINRIADSSNFNGINLLDGSLASRSTSALGGSTATVDSMMDGSAPSPAGAAEITLKMSNNAATASSPLDPTTRVDGVTPDKATNAVLTLEMGQATTPAVSFTATVGSKSTTAGSATVDLSDIANVGGSDSVVVKLADGTSKTYNYDATADGTAATAGKFNDLTTLTNAMALDGITLDATTQAAATATETINPKITISSGHDITTTTKVEDIADLEYASGKKLGDLFDIKVYTSGSTTPKADGTTVATGDKIVLTAKKAGDLGTTVNSAMDAVTGTNGSKATYVKGSDEGIASAGPAVTKYDLEINISKLRGGQSIQIGDKTIKFTSDLGTSTSTTATSNVYTINLNDGDASIARDLDTILDDIFDSTNFKAATSTTATETNAGNTETILKYSVEGKDNTVVNNSNMGQVRVFDANGKETTGNDPAVRKDTYTPAATASGTTTTPGAYAKVEYEIDTSKITEGNKITIGDKTIEIAATADLANGKVTKANINTELAQALEQMGYDSGKVTVGAGSAGKTKITIEGTKIGGTAAELLKGAGYVSFMDASLAPASQVTVNGGMTITAGTTDIASIKDAVMPGNGIALKDLFDITINGTTQSDSYVIQEGDEIKFTAKKNGALDQNVMDKFKFTGSVDSLTAKNGWDEGSNASGDKTHYELAINMSKVAGGNSFTFGNVNGKSITFDLSYDSKTTGNDTVGANDKDPISGNTGDRVTINLYGMTDAQAQQAIFDQVKAKMDAAGFDVTRAISGNTMTLSLDAKEEGAEYNLGNIRLSSQSGALTNAVYNPAGGSAGGTEGTMAQVTYDFDVSKLEVGDQLTFGDTTIHIGEKAGKETVDGKLKITVSAEDAKSDPNTAIVEALESAGYRSGQVKFDVTNNKVTVTGIKTGEKAEDLKNSGAKLSVTNAARSMTDGGLTLQIGDTSESFNQMIVGIGDMHTDAMGTTDGKSIADINIASQSSAQEAVQVIKDAINYVSSVRGDLGAIQNRLEHTQNNLSVMAENIQDAESTIRDTDVAEEMMSYVKNNILVQSAQAMLAQANQLPQGVLQLLG